MTQDEQRGSIGRRSLTVLGALQIYLTKLRAAFRVSSERQQSVDDSIWFTQDLKREGYFGPRDVLHGMRNDLTLLIREVISGEADLLNGLYMLVDTVMMIVVVPSFLAAFVGLVAAETTGEPRSGLVVASSLAVAGVGARLAMAVRHAARVAEEGGDFQLDFLGQPQMARSRWATSPNVISMSRVLLVAAIGVAVVGRHFMLASWLTCLAGISDFADGYVARRYGQRTKLGSWLDAVADRLLVLTLITASLVAIHVVPEVLGVIVLVREVLVGVAALRFRDGELRPNASGKVGFTLVVVALGFGLAAKTGSGTVYHVLSATGLVFIWLALPLLARSTWLYTRRLIASTHAAL